MGGFLHALIWRAVHSFTQGRGVESSQIGGGVLCMLYLIGRATRHPFWGASVARCAGVHWGAGPTCCHQVRPVLSPLSIHPPHNHQARAATTAITTTQHPTRHRSPPRVLGIALRHLLSCAVQREILQGTQATLVQEAAEEGGGGGGQRAGEGQRKVL